MSEAVPTIGQPAVPSSAEQMPQVAPSANNVVIVSSAANSIGEPATHTMPASASLPSATSVPDAVSFPAMSQAQVIQAQPFPVASTAQIANPGNAPGMMTFPMVSSGGMMTQLTNDGTNNPPIVSSIPMANIPTFQPFNVSQMMTSGAPITSMPPSSTMLLPQSSGANPLNVMNPVHQQTIPTEPQVQISYPDHHHMPPDFLQQQQGHGDNRVLVSGVNSGPMVVQQPTAQAMPNISTAHPTDPTSMAIAAMLQSSLSAPMITAKATVDPSSGSSGPSVQEQSQGVATANPAVSAPASAPDQGGDQAPAQSSDGTTPASSSTTAPNGASIPPPVQQGTMPSTSTIVTLPLSTATPGTQSQAPAPTVAMMTTPMTMQGTPMSLPSLQGTPQTPTAVNYANTTTGSGRKKRPRDPTAGHKQRCTCCRKLFHTKDALFQHLVRSSCVVTLWEQFDREDYFRCPECNFDTIAFAAAVNHCRAKHPDRIMSILNTKYPEARLMPCGVVVSTAKAIRKHQRTCKKCPDPGPKPQPTIDRVMCTICNKTYRKTSLRKHHDRAHSDVPYPRDSHFREGRVKCQPLGDDLHRFDPGDCKLSFHSREDWVEHAIRDHKLPLEIKRLELVSADGGWGVFDQWFQHFSAERGVNFLSGRSAARSTFNRFYSCGCNGTYNPPKSKPAAKRSKRSILCYAFIRAKRTVVTGTSKCIITVSYLDHHWHTVNAPASSGTISINDSNGNRITVMVPQSSRISSNNLGWMLMPPNAQPQPADGTVQASMASSLASSVIPLPASSSGMMPMGSSAHSTGAMIPNVSIGTVGMGPENPNYAGLQAVVQQPPLPTPGQPQPQPQHTTLMGANGQPMTVMQMASQASLLPAGNSQNMPMPMPMSLPMPTSSASTGTPTSIVGSGSGFAVNAMQPSLTPMVTHSQQAPQHVLLPAQPDAVGLSQDHMPQQVQVQLPPEQEGQQPQVEQPQMQAPSQAQAMETQADVPQD
eukprot:TRINITY_DN5801_c0_g2_i1.p1 TRINITY_DN5801_c0_g2~~TRINITY_DN5801_c0_g2_i1.p1  ORF type:complete len:1018 (+),score=245.00 TRINITY_DN5801_c0_g2_i1:97-3054(+)